MQIAFSFEPDCGCDDPVCIGFSFKCPCCSKEAEIYPRRLSQLYYIDMLGEWYGIKHGIRVWGFPVEYGLFDKSGRVDVLLLIWDGVSNRSKRIKENALRRGVVIFEVVCDVESVELIENPDCRVVDAIRKRLIVNDGYCPCTPHKDDDHICPCLKFRDYGECCCRLYVRAS